MGLGLAELFAKHEEKVRRNFEDIPELERLSPDPVLCGLLKVKSLARDPKRRVIQGADHDVIWLLDENQLEEVSEEDVIYLIRCGVWWHDDNECLARFV